MLRVFWQLISLHWQHIQNNIGSEVFIKDFNFQDSSCFNRTYSCIILQCYAESTCMHYFLSIWQTRPYCTVCTAIQRNPYLSVFVWDAPHWCLNSLIQSMTAIIITNEVNSINKNWGWNYAFEKKYSSFLYVWIFLSFSLILDLKISRYFTIKHKNKGFFD